MPSGRTETPFRTRAVHRIEHPCYIVGARGSRDGEMPRRFFVDVRRCERCGKEYATTHPAQRFCDRSCAASGPRPNRKKGLRPTATCPCGAKFSPQKPSGRYCSVACRQRFFTPSYQRRCDQCGGSTSRGPPNSGSALVNALSRTERTNRVARARGVEVHSKALIGAGDSALASAATHQRENSEGSAQRTGGAAKRPQSNSGTFRGLRPAIPGLTQGRPTFLSTDWSWRRSSAGTSNGMNESIT